jgi:hypothetical protein
MARKLKPQEPDTFRMRANHGLGECCLMGDGLNSSVWVSDSEGNFASAFHGPATLRAFAKAILAEVGEGE